MKDLKDTRILVTPNSFGKHNPDLKTELEESVGEVIYNTSGKPLTSQQVAEFLPEIDGYIAGLDQIDRAALEMASSLRVIVRYGVGYDKVDLVAASEKGIIVSNTPGANSASVAELALCLVLMLARQIKTATQAIQKGGWPRVAGLSLQDKTVGILGMGVIGKHFAKLLATFECKIIAYDVSPDVDFLNQHHIELVDLETIITKSDFLSLHVPLLPETHNMVNDTFIKSMKTGAYLINTSRGEILNEAALIRGLETGHLAGAALDAFEIEPPEADHPLLSHPQVICTPHIGAQTDGATNNMGKMALEECLRVLQGFEPKYQVN